MINRHVVVACAVFIVSVSVTTTGYATPIVYGTDVSEPQEMAFSPNGVLYVGHSANSYGMSIYQIPSGGGSGASWGNDAFDDPDGVDIGSDGTVYSTTGLWWNKQTGEIVGVSPDGSINSVGSNYLRNPTSLIIDRASRFTEGGFVVAHQSSAVNGVQILSVSPDGNSITAEYASPNFTVLRELTFDTNNCLWFLADSNLFKWETGMGSQPQQVSLGGISDGDIAALGYDALDDSLVVGIASMQSLVRVDRDGVVGSTIATGIDPHSITVASDGAIYVSDIVSDVVWKVPEPSTFSALIFMALGGLAFSRRRGIHA